MALVFGWDGYSVDKERYELVKLVVTQRLRALLEGQEVADPINLFIKPEPHKAQKIADGRLRLISGVSLVDGIIDRMLFGKLFDAALANVGKTPALLGWNPLCGGHRLLLGQFPSGAISVDKSSWDWSVPAWMVQIFLRFVLEMYYGHPDWFLNLIKIRFNLLFKKAVFATENVTQPQDFEGVMKSGCFLTLLLNSLGQSVLHYVIALRMMLGDEYDPFSFGDDTLQRAGFDVDLYVRIMESLGFKPKVNPVSDHLEFVGFLMDKDRVVPAYWKKHLFLLKYLKEDVAIETLVSYQMLYHQCPEMLWLVQAELQRRCPQLVKSPETLRVLYAER